ncbi:MAG TPA: NAD(P)-dependent oxidoreductase [Candidatus Binataceae bacterium]|nr:NAD(P)-dependent oxidoreductase [Candidatus Binataceae bacterium]
MQIAWIGTGIMGAPMARRLLKGGHKVAAFNRTPEKAQRLAADGAVVVADPSKAAQDAEIIFVMVSDTPDVEAVIARIRPALKKGQLVIDMSTISPVSERATSESLREIGVDYLDAPVSGGETGAIEGTLAIMVGGEKGAFDRAKPILELLGKRITYMGPSGAGQMTKLANQIAVSITLEAAAEALAFAKAGGLDPSQVLEAIGAGAAASWQLNNLGPKIIASDWRPGFFIKLIRKDLRLVGEAARQSSLALPGLKMMTSMFNSAAVMGHDLDGTQAVAVALDSISRVK